MNANYLTIKKAQAMYGVSRSFFYQLKKTGQLNFHYIPGKKTPFIKLSEFERLMLPMISGQLVRPIELD